MNFASRSFASSTTALTLSLALLLVSAACGGPAAPPPAAVVKPAERPLSPAAIAANDTARFSAGLKGRPGGPFEEFERTPAWQDYAKGFEETWAQFEKTQAEPMRAFEQKELASSSPPPKDSFVFYPFSGPDVLYMTGFFPGRSLYVMVGLEPAGTLPAPSSFEAAKIVSEVEGWTKSVRSIFKRSFFVTSEMDAQFRGRLADGSLESLCLLLARSGYTIEGIRHGNLTEEGAFTDYNAATAGVDAKGKPKKPLGVEVAFRRGPLGDPQKIFYFSAKLGSDFKTNPPGFSRFLLSLGHPDTLIKSAQFIMHWPGMGDMRNQILETSRLILEDDTGIPFKYLQPPTWDVKLYGEYSAPDKPFKTWYQKNLVKAFEDPAKVTPLGLQLGYGAGRRPSSLILARRVAAATTPPPAPAQTTQQH